MSILIVSNTNDPTADFLQRKLEDRAIPHFRLNTEIFLTEMRHSCRISDIHGSSTVIRHGDSAIDLASFKSVWYRRPVRPILDVALSSPQSQEYANEETTYYQRCLWQLLDTMLWVNHPLATRSAELKLKQLELAGHIGLRIPSTLATNDPNEARQFVLSHNSDVVAKPFLSHFFEYSDNIGAALYTTRLSRTDCENLASVKYCITLFQEYVEKKDEVRVTVVGKDIFAAAIDSQSDSATMNDWRRMSPRPKKWVHHDLPPTVAQACFSMINAFNLRFGAIDFIRTPDDEYVFLELNPNGQWAWLEVDLGIEISESLIKCLTGST